MAKRNPITCTPLFGPVGDSPSWSPEPLQQNAPRTAATVEVPKHVVTTNKTPDILSDNDRRRILRYPFNPVAGVVSTARSNTCAECGVRIPYLRVLCDDCTDRLS